MAIRTERIAIEEGTFLAVVKDDVTYRREREVNGKTRVSKEVHEHSLDIALDNKGGVLTVSYHEDKAARDADFDVLAAAL